MCCALIFCALVGASRAEAAYGVPTSSSYNAYSYYSWASKVTFGGMVNDTTSITSGTQVYWDYTSKIGYVAKGQSFTVRVDPSPVVSYITFPYRAAFVWIDWNKNQTWAETMSGAATEKYVHGTSAVVYSPVPVLNVAVNGATVAANQSEGPTRLRVRSMSTYSTSFSTAIPSAGEAYDSFYGYNNPNETEDYTIFVVVPPNVQPVSVENVWEGTSLVPSFPSATSGLPPFTWSLANSANADWVSVDPSTGRIYGVAPSVTANSAVSFSLVCTDAMGQTGSRQVSFTVKSGLAQPFQTNLDGPDISSLRVISGSQNSSAFAAGQGVSGTTGFYSASTTDSGWSVTTGIANDANQWLGASALPRTGILETFFEIGNATEGEISFDYKIHNSTSSQNAANLAVLISNDRGVSWTAVSGTGATLNHVYRTPTNGQFVTETFRFPATGSDGLFGLRVVSLVRQTAGNTFVAVDNVQFHLPLQILTNANLPIGQQKVPYPAVTLEAGGGLGVVTGWSVAPGSQLPDGIELLQNGSDWTLSGVPGNLPGGGFSASFALIVSDSVGKSAQKTFNLTLLAEPAALQISTHAYLPSGAIGVPGQWQLAATGGLPDYTFDFVDMNQVPAWLSMTSSGLLQGTPDTPGVDSVSFDVMVTDNPSRAGFQESSIKTLHLMLTERLTLDPAQFTVSPLISLPVAEVGRSFNRAIPLWGGTPPYGWTIAAGNLPSGIVLDSDNGMPFLRGAPLVGTTGSYIFTLTVTDEIGYSLSDPNYSPDNTGFGSQYASFTFRVNVAPASTSTMSVATKQEDLPATLAPMVKSAMWLSAIGGRPPYTFGVSGVGKPSWVTVSSTGYLTASAPASASGGYLVGIEVTDTAGQRATKTLTLNVETPYVFPQFVTEELLTARDVGQQISLPINFSGGEPPYTMTLVNGVDVEGDGRFEEGGLPVGIHFSPASGRLTGIVLASNEPGMFVFTIVVVDGQNSMISREFSLPINSASGSPLVITTTTVDQGIAGAAYAIGLQAAGGVGSHVWSMKAGTGSLPPGLVLTPYGVLTGVIPQGTTGQFSFTVEVKDEAMATYEQSYAMLVAAPGAQNPSTPATGEVPDRVESGVEGAGAGCAMSGSGSGQVWLMLLMGMVGLVALRGSAQRD